MNDFRFQTEPELSTQEFVDVLKRSTLAERRPVDNEAQVTGMLQQADVIVTARSVNGLLVGVARAITDFHYCTYLADLAVAAEVQRLGIGRRLLQRAHEVAGLQTNLILLAAPAAADYYPHIGLQPHTSCWVSPAQDA